MKKKFLVILIFILITVVMVISGTLKEAEDLFWDGQNDQALVEFQKIAEDTSRSVDEQCTAYMFIADIYHMKGDTKNCEDNLIKVLLLNENYIPDVVKISKEVQVKLKELKSGEALKKIKISKIIEKYHLIKIPAGEFWMGCPSGEGGSNEQPRHKVYLDEYYISKYEVTNNEYAQFLNDYGKDTDDNGRKMIYDSKKKQFGGYNWGLNKKGNIWQPVNDYENHPVIFVTWYGAVQYCKWLSDKTGLNFRLPTEAEWEKACRAGRGSKEYYFVENVIECRPVGEKKPNCWGLYDMCDNVEEFCSDWYGKKYYSNSPSHNPKGPASGSYRVFRGDSIMSSIEGEYCCADRNGYPPARSSCKRGFRPVMIIK